MCWSYTYQSQRDLIRDLVRSEEDENRSIEVLAHAHVPRDYVLWSVAEVTVKPGGVHPDLAPGESRRFIRCDLLDPGPIRRWYKRLDEAMRPPYHSCPERFLKMAPEVCPEWRQGVRAYHADRRARKSCGTAPA